VGREIVGRDLVVWHVFGVTHVPRLEDWPVMPVETTGFGLRPVGFFDASPCMDVPPTARVRARYGGEAASSGCAVKSRL